MDFSVFSDFVINCGVKQGGILSPFLFNLFIDDLIWQCTNLDVGALYEGLNVNILVYADDITIISPVDSHLQRLLDVCSEYSDSWLIRFNPKKSNIITFGNHLFPKTEFFLGKTKIDHSDKIKYLGIEIPNNLDFDLLAREKFKRVSKSIFSLSYLGLSPKGISPFLKAFLYKTFCLSQFTYSLETNVLSTKTKDFLNIKQNNIFRQLLSLKKFCHMSKILKCLKIYDFNTLYIKSKLSFIQTLKKNEVCSYIFKCLCQNLNNPPKKNISFQSDILILQNNFNVDIKLIYDEPLKYNKCLIKSYQLRNDGLADSIMICLSNFNNNFFYKLLNDLINHKF